MNNLETIINEYNELIIKKEDCMAKSLYIMKCARLTTALIITIPITIVLFIVSIVYICKGSKCEKQAKQICKEILYEIIINQGVEDLIEIERKYYINNSFTKELDELIVNHVEFSKYNYDSTRTKLILKDQVE